MSKKILFALALLLSACPRPLPPPTPPTPGTADAGPPDEAKRPCLAVCRTLARLGCPAAAPTPEGASCTRVCENVQNSGVLTWKIDCMKKAKTCDEADQCNQ